MPNFRHLKVGDSVVIELGEKPDEKKPPHGTNQYNATVISIVGGVVRCSVDMDVPGMVVEIYADTGEGFIPPEEDETFRSRLGPKKTSKSRSRIIREGML